MAVNIDESGREVLACCVSDVGGAGGVSAPAVADPGGANRVAGPRNPGVGNNLVTSDKLCGMDDLVVHS